MEVFQSFSPLCDYAMQSLWTVPQRDKQWDESNLYRHILYAVQDQTFPEH